MLLMLHNGNGSHFDYYCMGCVGQAKCHHRQQAARVITEMYFGQIPMSWQFKAAHLGRQSHIVSSKISILI